MPIVTNAGCSYKSLKNYNGREKGTMDVPVSNTPKYQIVPTYDSIGYDALTHGVEPSCTGYFSVANAYGGSQDQLYTKKSCM